MHTPLLIVGAVLLLVTVYAALLWVVVEQTLRQTRKTNLGLVGG
jgi:peptidoglycan/LPS O-acetylase OafA/YrhL